MDLAAGQSLGVLSVTTDGEERIHDSRPRLRGECIDADRPCTWIGCRYHLAINISATGRMRAAHVGIALVDLEETCALDVADRGTHTLEEVGDLVGLTRERVRQIEQIAFDRLRRFPAIRHFFFVP